MVVEMTPFPEGWPGNSNFLAKYSPCREEFFDCGAVELAQKFVSKYLYCHKYKIVVRILETEAYPEVDDARVYSRVFWMYKGNPQFKIKGGRIVACKRDGFELVLTDNKMHLYITAGKAESGDVVYLRSCQPIEGHHLIEKHRNMTTDSSEAFKKNILIGPWHVSEGFGIRKGWREDPDLNERSGIQLFLADPPEEMVVFCGSRNLEATHASADPNFKCLQEYRFALETHNPAYDYWKETLKLQSAQCAPHH